MRQPREASDRLLEMIEDGILDRDNVIMACVKYMSEDDVADMCHINEFFYDAEDAEEDGDMAALVADEDESEAGA